MFLYDVTDTVFSALWKHACDEVMQIKPPTKNKMPFFRKSSIYEDTPLIGKQSWKISSFFFIFYYYSLLSIFLAYHLFGTSSKLRRCNYYGYNVAREFYFSQIVSEPDSVSDSIVNDLKVDDAHLSQMLTTLMGEASQIRGGSSRHGSTS